MSAQLRRFIRKFSPNVAKKARSSFAALRKLLPGASVLVYDNYNALAIAFSADESVKNVVCSIALYPQWVSLFLVGKKLPDPKKLLRGGGKTMRHVVLDEWDIDDALIHALIRTASKRIKLPKK